MSRRIVVLVGLAALMAASTAQAQQRSRSRGNAAQATPAQEPAAPPAEPTPSDRARELFLRGQAAYQQGDYAVAASSWEEAYGLDARPALQFNLAQAYGRLGRLEDEHAALRRFVDGAAADDPLLVSARARLATIEQRLARTGIVLRGEAYEGAVILVDGEDRGRLPHPDAIALRPGSHTVDITKTGFLPFHAAVVVPAGESVTVTVVMQEAPSVAGHAAHPMRLPIALYSAGGALIATGAVFGGLALSKSSGAIEGSSAADSAHTFAIVSDVAIGVGVATAATGLVFHLLRRKDRHEDATATGARAPGASVSFAPTAGPRNFGLSAFGRF